MIVEIVLFSLKLNSLTPTDYDHLARAVQVEAAPNTMDEYCVAASILNRVASPYYPNTVADVIYSPNQYEGLQNKNPTPKRSVVLRLKDKKKLTEAYNIIGDRTDFKGQSMLQYRVVAEDPMCHSKGNFFHYRGQG